LSTESFSFPASFAQQRLWFLDQFDPGQSVYNMGFAVRIESPLDVGAMEKSLNELVKRHESLRTTFTNIDGEPVQTVARQLDLTLKVVDLTGADEAGRENEAIKLVEATAAEPFDLATGPLLRSLLAQLGEATHILSFVMHHIISDGWSMGVFLRELGTFYQGFVNGRPVVLDELPIQYADYASWQRDWLQGRRLTEQVDYWRDHLLNAPPTLDLGSDRLRPSLQTFKGARLHSELPATLLAELRNLSRREGVTLFMTLLSAFDVLMSKFSGQADIVVGTPIAGRNRTELEGIIGYFANTLPLRVDLTGNPSFNNLLKRVREVALGAYAHQDVPFDKLVEELQPDRSLSHSPLFQVIFALENTPQTQTFPGLDVTWMNIDRGTSRSDLSLFASEQEDCLSCMWEFSTDLFDHQTIEQIISSFETLLQNVVSDSATPIGYLDIWSEQERRELVTKWNSTELESSASETMHARFETQTNLTPNAVAVACNDRKLTFGELNSRANQLAHRLQQCGVSVETPVGVFLDRSVETIVALLGILKSGGCYVPIDPAYPAARVAFMLVDSEVPVLLTESKLLSSLPSLPTQTICLDDWSEFERESAENPTSSVTAENLAYIIYTSGSTGTPKGVEVTHRTVVHLLDATKEQLGFRAGDVWTVVHSYAFDFSVWEIWGCLLQGGTLVVVPLEVVQSPPELFDLLCREGVTVLNQTPSALRELLSVREQARRSDADWNLRVIVCGGDALDQELAIELEKLDVPIWNFYGPTESTVWTTCTEVTQTSVCDSSQKVQMRTEEQTEVRSTVSIGEPIRGLQVYLLDQYLQPVPAGVPGELLIGGAGLARGYSRRSALTAEKFIPDLFGYDRGDRLYRTGDLARHRRDGSIEFIGRIDNQVKLRGFRVELGEIESALTQHSRVEQAVVIIREDQNQDRRLVAYVVSHNGETLSPSELRDHLRLTLPDYMVPAAFVGLAEIPLTPNKKVDRRALPAPDYSPDYSNGQAAGLATPRTPVEELLVGIWSQVLRLPSVGIHDDFFALGGHSLLATQVISRIRQVLNIELPVRILFECLTIESMARRLDGMVESSVQAPPIVTVERSGKLPLSFAQQRLWFLDQLEPGNSFYNVGRALRLRGPLDIKALTAAINHIILRHESLRTAFEADEGNPYQRILNHAPSELPLIDLREFPVELRQEKADELAAGEVKQPFDLTKGPFLRTKLIRVDDDDHVLILTMHHIAADEWSLAILFRELSSLYNAFTKEKSSSLRELSTQYADYAAWQRQWLQGEDLEKLISYWREQLDGAPTILNLPTDKPRPAVQSFRGAYEEFEMSRELLDRLKHLSRSEGVTLFMTCLAAYQLQLARFSGQSDLLIGTDVANRNRVETESLIGFFTNLVPLRARVSDDLDFVSLLHQVRETTLEAYAHQDLPFEKLVEALRPERDPGRNPMVQVLLVMQNPNVPIVLNELEVSRFDLPLESSRFDLVLFLSEGESGLSGFWLYNPDLFEKETILRLSRNYEKLLEQVVTERTTQLGSFGFLDEPLEQKPKEMDKKDSQQNKLSRLRNIRRKGVDLAQAGSINTSFLRGDQTLPLVFEPGGDEIDLPEWAAGNRQFIEERLLDHGALLFRRFSIESVPEFEKFAGAICPDLFGEYGDLPREELGGKVYGSTPYPSDERILFHNESSHMHRWPMLIWFYCVQPAQQGGESPIIDCRQIYRELDPSIRDKFESKGLMYVRNFTDGLDVSWQNFFHTTDRKAVEEYCRQASIDFEWKGDNGLRTRQVGPAVIKHPQTGQLAFFNQLQLHHIACLAPAVRESLLSMMPEEDLPRNVYYGDGTQIETSVMESIGELYDRLGVSFRWQKHDVLMLNNMLVAHSRNPYLGERKIVVALGNLVSKSD
jgi:amino acid adenylation domain-containing protein